MRSAQSRPSPDSGVSGVGRPWLRFVVLGGACILAGGFVAAAGGEDPSRHLSWACAYLVLVCGSAQIFLGGGRALIGVRAPGWGTWKAELVTFNLGNAAVLLGTLLGVQPLLYAGSLALVVALVVFAQDTRGQGIKPGTALLIYRLGILALVLSVPVGAVLGS